MSNSTSLKPVISLLGGTLALALALSPLARAAENPFNSNAGGIMIAGNEGNDKDAGKSEAMKKCDETKNADEKKKCQDEVKAKEDKAKKGKK